MFSVKGLREEGDGCLHQAGPVHVLNYCLVGNLAHVSLHKVSLVQRSLELPNVPNDPMDTGQTESRIAGN